MRKVVPIEFFQHFEATIDEYVSQYSQRVNRNQPPPLSTKKGPANSEKVRVVHEPRHDVESMFWVLCIALARAKPRDAHDSQPSNAYNRFCRHMLLESDSTQLRSSRGSYLRESEKEWQEILHPDLAGAASLLHHMGNYLAIRTYDAKRESWGLYHAHDMFRLLLLATIERFRDDPIFLCNHAPRCTSSPHTTRAETTSIRTSRSHLTPGSLLHYRHFNNIRAKRLIW
jgi:hypothetical protein